MVAIKIDGVARQTILVSLVLLFFFISPLLHAQERSTLREDFWVCPIAEASLYSLTSVAFGGGAALGYGDGVSLGLKVIYCSDINNNLRTLEINFLTRLYLPRLTGHSGLFLQFAFGPVLFTPGNENIAVPSGLGVFSAGASLGWRFIFGRNFFLEPAIRGGYPFIAGLGLAAGVRF